MNYPNKLSFALFGILLSVICFVPKAKGQKHEFYQIAQSADKFIPPDDMDELTTQSELNTSDFPRRMDSLLNAIYQSILKYYQTDTAFIRTFKASQRAWLQFRDAELLSIMPPRPPEEHGSIEALCYWEYKVAITKRRIEELLMWFNGEEEGNSCGTSYGIDKEIKQSREKVKHKSK